MVRALTVGLFSIFCAVAILCNSKAFAASINGDTLKFDYLYPFTGSISESHTLVVPGAVVGYHFGDGTATFSGSSIVLDNSGCVVGCSFNFTPGGFNGVRITDLTNPSALSSWAVSAALTTMAGFSEYISGGAIFVDWQGLSIAGNITLVDAAAAPVPAALPLFATGLAGLGWLARRRRKQAA